MLDQLSAYVKENNLPAIKKTIQQIEGEEKRFPSWDRTIAGAMRDAIELGHRQILPLFLEKGFSPDNRCPENDGRGFLAPLIYYAARANDLATVKLLVDKGAQITPDRNGNSQNDLAMRGALETGNREIVAFLLNKGASPNGIYSKCLICPRTFIQKAAEDGDAEMVALLAKHGADMAFALGLCVQRFRRNEWGSKARTPEADATYGNALRLLLDHAMGVHLHLHGERFSFLEDIDVTGFNFVGVAVDGEPVTREGLQKAGVKGAEKAIVTTYDIGRIRDKDRRTYLQSQLEKAFIAHGRLTDGKGVVNFVPLALAVEQGDTAVVGLRLAAGASPNAHQSKFQFSPVIIKAAKKGLVEICKMLAGHPTIDKTHIPLAAAAAEKKGHSELAAYIESLVDLDAVDRNGAAPIHHAVERGDVKEVKRLIARGVDLDLKKGGGGTPLGIAASHSWDKCFGKPSEKHLEILSLLLENGADPNHWRYWSPLQEAAEHGSAAAFEILLPLTEKKEIEKKERYSSKPPKIIPWYVPLMAAAQRRREWKPMLTLLKEAGADFNTTDERRDEFKTLLGEQVETVAFCAKGVCGYDPDDDFSKKVCYNELEKLRFLLENGANPGLPTGPDARTALHLAAHYGNLEAANVLVEYGAKIDARDKDQRTPLHYAALGHSKMTRFLLRSGADVNAVDKDGLTPYQFSRRYSKERALKYQVSEEQDRPYRHARGALKRHAKRMAQAT